MRLFVAVWPSEEAAAVLTALARPEVPGVRWCAPAQWHVTLAFLGEVEDTVVPGVAAALGPLAHRARARAVFGPATERFARDGALVAPVSGVSVLAEAIKGALVGAGLAPEERPFRGHLTLARARRGRGVPSDLVGTPIAAEWEVPTVDLVASTLAPGGSRYETADRVELAR